MRIVTLITDFGWQDLYVGQLKGRLLQICPTILPLDLTHGIPAWDRAAAARALHESWSFFPAGTIHLVVVDPGVGSARQLVAASGQGHFFLGPDNGVFSLLLQDGVLTEARTILAPPAETVSPTFHGRDILAPAAGRLATGTKLAELGPERDLAVLVRLPEASPLEPDVTSLAGEVLSVDHFGNVRTSFHPGRLGLALTRIQGLEVQGVLVQRQVRCYAEAAPGELCWLTDSGGYLELACNQDRAVDRLSCQPGDALCLLLTLPLKRA